MLRAGGADVRPSRAESSKPPSTLVFVGKLAHHQHEASSTPNFFNEDSSWKHFHPEDRQFDSTLCLSINKLAILSYSANERFNYSQKAMHNSFGGVLSSLWIIWLFYFWLIEAINLIVRADRPMVPFCVRGNSVFPLPVLQKLISSTVWIYMQRCFFLNVLLEYKSLAYWQEAGEREREGERTWIFLLAFPLFSHA